MLTQEDDVEIHALWTRGWSVSAISRHTGRDRKTVRRYLQVPGPARAVAPSCLEPYRAYIAARFQDDHHLEATVLYRELVDAGFGRAYTTLVRELRRLELRPVCLVCAHRLGGQVTTEIDHFAGGEIQWDWLELSAADTPWGEPADVLVGALAHSGRFRAVFCQAQSFGHLAGAAHQVLVALGGTPKVWRTDRMATVVEPRSGRITADAAAMAKHYGTTVAVCPARRAQRKGVVEAAIKYLTRSWWRTAAVANMGDAQRSLEAWSVSVADTRKRPLGTVGEIGAGEPLLALPAAAYPAQIIVERKVSRAALAAFEGNQYSVPPAHAGRMVTVTWRISEPMLRIVGAHGEIVAEHRRIPAGAGQTVRSTEHAASLQDAVLAAFTTKDACRRKPNLPPGDSALAEIAKLRGLDPGGARVISLADYATLAEAAAR